MNINLHRANEEMMNELYGESFLKEASKKETITEIAALWEVHWEQILGPLHHNAASYLQLALLAWEKRNDSA